MSRRGERVEDLLRAEISELLLREVKDPRLAGLVTITEVSTSPDYRQAKVFVSVLGSETEKHETLAGLTSATGFLRRRLRQRLTLKHTPELTFQLDDSIERGAHLLRLMKDVVSEAQPPGPDLP